MSLAPSSPQPLIMWPGWESEGGAACYCDRIGWWLEACYLELWSSSAYVLHCWLVNISKYTLKTIRLIRHVQVSFTSTTLSHIQILFREYGWPEKAPIRPQYRLVQLAYNMDDYSSKGSRIVSLRKTHRNQQVRTTQDSIEPGAMQ